MSHLETLTRTPERTTELRHWNMETQPDHPETYSEFLVRVMKRLKTDDDGTYPDSVITDIVEVPKTGIEQTDNMGLKGKQAREWATHLEYDQKWWLNLNGYHDVIAGNIFEHQRPTEQFIVGKDDKGIRVYNFSDPMDASHQNDLRKFVDVAAQYVGNTMYDLFQDIVITDFKKPYAESDHGFMDSDNSDVIFLNAKLLTEEPDEPSDIEESMFLQALWHEFGHHIVRLGAKDGNELYEFAKSIGWRVDLITRDKELGIDPRLRMSVYGPSAVFASDRKSQSKSKETKGPLKGSPTEYGASDPEESLVETTRFAALGSRTLNSLMPETRDAWLKYISDVKGGPITTPLKRKPVVMERRIGSDIIYPRVELPDAIRIHEVPTYDQAV